MNPSCLSAAGLLLGAYAASAQLALTVPPAKVTGQKAVLPLVLSNGLPAKVESARAAVFLLDEQGRMIAQGTRWIVGGEPGRAGLAPGGTNVFHFVVTADQPFASTNLTPKVAFTRVVLAGGRLADPAKDVRVTPAPR
jgi:hypothetical protein